MAKREYLSGAGQHEAPVQHDLGKLGDGQAHYRAPGAVNALNQHSALPLNGVRARFVVRFPGVQIGLQQRLRPVVEENTAGVAE